MKEIKRCKWVNMNNPLYIKYHDEEWGHINHDDQYLFEMLLLESFQAGLSWECILNKRENFRKAFANFNYEIIAQYNDEDIKSLLNNEGIIRNSLKIKASIKNANVFMDIRKEWGSFDQYIWHFTDGKVIKGKGEVTSNISDEISKDLKGRGMRFVGSTTIQAYLQAIGIIDDHEEECSFHSIN